MKALPSYFGQLRVCLRLLVAGLLVMAMPIAGHAKGYSSGGGRSYSSGGSSSHSSGGSSHSYGSSSHSFSSGSGGRSSGSSGGGSSHSFSSGSGRSSSSSGSGSSSSGFSSGRKSYSSGGERTSYSSGKSYSSGSEHTFTPRSSEAFDANSGRPRKSSSASSASPGSSPSGMTFDSGASRAAKEAASKRDFTDYKQAQAAKSSAASGDNSSSPRSRTFDPSGNAPPVIPRSSPPTINGQTTSYGGGGYGYPGSYHQYNYYPDPRTYSTRSVRIHNYYGSYYSRPYVYYNDNYSSLFWWWLLDRPLEERAMWTYYHRNDMDPARYQALVYNDLALDQRVRELEQRQVPVDTNYVPQGMDRDLMYSDKYIDRAYHNRPTHNGQIAFWFILIPTAIGVGGFFVWLVFFKRFQTSTA